MNKKVNGYTPIFTGHTKSHICINNFYLSWPALLKNKAALIMQTQPKKMLWYRELIL
jgi:hypothetical protein